MKKTLASIALASSIAFVGSAPAMAGEPVPYPAPAPTGATVSDGTLAPGETFVFTGQGFLAGEPVTITITIAPAGGTNAGGTALSAKIPVYQAPQTLSTTADAQGRISVPLTINEPGTYSITAKGSTSGVTVGPVIVTVAAPVVPAAASGNSAANASNGGGLAATGADSGLVLWTLVGAGAVAAGATSVVVVRRRAKSEAAA
ncbi:LPXTG cell wall anchor domain-containing protein [Pseudarthrobacter sp. NamE5]|uniref:LPXTG cell wall anchor domain-containing protein n=1 Tax=Pseudarthrobacter sp. NamE5 TaxID=2576839 RepID=UPI00110B4D58|nr:LPXTG cell wall anchor domain-containing protein [Pseudarthrobacter sp. NamE5]TLM81680.1 LPXTG cell wall anchor domain-containing protein [Pseudarthrobacter sp. NamE5]